MALDGTHPTSAALMAANYAAGEAFKAGRRDAWGYIREAHDAFRWHDVRATERPRRIALGAYSAYLRDMGLAQQQVPAVAWVSGFLAAWCDESEGYAALTGDW